MFLSYVVESCSEGPAVTVVTTQIFARLPQSGKHLELNRVYNH